MNQAHHRKLRDAGWHYDPISQRYSAPGVALDGNQKMVEQADAYATYEAALAKQKAPAAAKDDKAS